MILPGDPRLPDSFWIKVQVGQDCWEWTGYVDKSGYGKFGGKAVHRLVSALIEPIPAGYVIDHQCHVAGECSLGRKCPHRRCVNPSHLKAITNEENVTRGNWYITQHRAPQTVCIRGHDKIPGKSCTECRRLRRLPLTVAGGFVRPGRRSQ